MINRVEIIPELLVIEPRIFSDERGYFFESYNKKELLEFGVKNEFVQDNESKSIKGVLRGLHYQTGEHAQAKLVRVTKGEVFDVAVDMRKNSITYGQWYGLILSEDNKKQFYIPRGFAHGFLVLSETAVFSYKCDNYYNKDSEGGVIYNDTHLNINWPDVGLEYIVSEKDRILPSFSNAKNFDSK